MRHFFILLPLLLISLSFHAPAFPVVASASPSVAPAFPVVASASPSVAPAFCVVASASPVVAPASPSVAPPFPVPGGWWPIENIADSDVQENGRYAVSEHNRKSGDNLVLLRILSGETAVVAGVKYRLCIEVMGGTGNVALYEAEVYERAWEHYRELTSFKQV